jgi:hypothetical protein
MYASDDSDGDDIDIEASTAYHAWLRGNTHLLTEERYLLTIRELHNFRWKIFYSRVPITYQKINNEFQRLQAREDAAWNVYTSTLRRLQISVMSKKYLCDNVESRLTLLRESLQSNGGTRWYDMHQSGSFSYV